jgi:DNA-binding PadR family transcriptional regulator
MDKLILGLLMLRRLTVYELRGFIQKYFQSMCSSSLGGIRAAINKLLDAQMITCNEYVERSVNKKQYSITDKGREEFLEWVHTPADLSVPKNIELAKFYSMGFLTPERRLQALDEIIAMLENTVSKFMEIKDSVNVSEAISGIMAYWESDSEYKEGFKAATQNDDIAHATKISGDYQMLSLQYQIDLTKFQIEWFKKIKNEVSSDGRQKKNY